MRFRTGAAGKVRAMATAGALVPALVGLSACTVSVRDAAVQEPASDTPRPAAPSITPGHDAEAVASKDLPLAAGDTLSPGVAVGVSDGLKDTPGWKHVRVNVQGENEFTKADGCTVASKVRTNQNALSVEGSDRASTAALFQYVDPSILPEYLRVDTLRWGGDADKPTHRAEVLALEGNTHSGTRATVVFARLFSKAGSSVYISVSCPDANALSAAKADVASHLALIPPSE